MTCSCQKVDEPAPLVQSGLPYSLVVGTTTVAGRDGRNYAIKTCLVPPMRQPKGGWSVEFYVKGQKHIISGSPRDIFIQTKRLFDLNGVEYTDLELWFNLNLQWTERAVEKYQKVRYRELMTLAIPNF